MAVEEDRALVIDVGSRTTKVGFAGDDAPRADFPSVVGRWWPQDTGPSSGRFCRTAMYKLDSAHDPFEDCVGKAAESKSTNIRHSYPVQNGIVTNWDDMEKILHHAFYNELRVSPDEHPVQLTEPALTPKANRERITQIMFETFNVPAMSMRNQGALSLFASGKTTGVNIDAGHHLTQVVPVYEGYYLPHAVQVLKLGGSAVTDSLMTLLSKKRFGRDYSFTTASDRPRAVHMKETLAYVAVDGEEETTKKAEKTYELPDGTALTIGEERFQCTEVLFQPSLAAVESLGVANLTHTATMLCDTDIRKELFSNIVLSGGSSLFPGFVERVKQDVSALTPRPVTVNVVAPPQRKFGAWVGGSILAATSPFEITKAEYEEAGPAIVHRKCL